jgi:hypothetical protein
MSVTTPLFLPEPPKFRKSVKSLHFRVFYSPEQPLICPDERDTMRHSWMYNEDSTRGSAYMSCIASTRITVLPDRF